MRYQIYQLKPGDRKRLRFMGSKYLKESGNWPVDPSMYEVSFDRENVVENTARKTTYDALERLYSVINRSYFPETVNSRPTLSVGDIVVLSDTPDDSWISPGAYFCDSFGFVSLDPETTSAFGGGEEDAEAIHPD